MSLWSRQLHEDSGNLTFSDPNSDIESPRRYGRIGFLLAGEVGDRVAGTHHDAAPRAAEKAVRHIVLGNLQERMHKECTRENEGRV